MGKETDIDSHYLSGVHFPNTIWSYLLCHSSSYQEIRLNIGRFSKALFTLMCSTVRFLAVPGPLKWEDSMINGTQKKKVIPWDKLWPSVEEPNRLEEPNHKEGCTPCRSASLGLGWGLGVRDNKNIFFFSPLDCLSEALPRLKCMFQSTE